jgi:hypothetical protein
MIILAVDALLGAPLRRAGAVVETPLKYACGDNSFSGMPRFRDRMGGAMALCSELGLAVQMQRGALYEQMCKKVADGERTALLMGGGNRFDDMLAMLKASRGNGSPARALKLKPWPYEDGDRDAERTYKDYKAHLAAESAREEEQNREWARMEAEQENR